MKKYGANVPLCELLNFKLIDMNNIRTLKTVTEEKGSLLKELKSMLDLPAKDFDEEKVKRITGELEKKNLEIDLIKQEQGETYKSLISKEAPELRIYGSRETIKGGRPGDLEQWMSDVVKSAFGVGGIQNRDILESSGSGQYVTPAPLATTLIDYITERSVIGRLGVPGVACESDTQTYGQVSTIPTADVIAEGNEVTETDSEFTPHTLQMYSYRAGVILSQEFLEDSIANPQDIIKHIAQSIAENIDYDFVNGAAPLGLANMTGTYLRYRIGENGASLSGYEELGTLWQKARELNVDLSAFVLSPRTMKEIRLLETATEEVPKPNPFADIPFVETNMVLNTDTVGTSDNCSRIYAGDYRKGCVMGWRYGSAGSMRFLVDRATLGEFGKVRVYGVCRAGIMHPYGTGIFGYISGIIPPAGAIT